MAVYFWAWYEESEDYREIDDQLYGLPENPTEDELKAVAQKIIRDHGTNADGRIYIGEGIPVKAEDIAPDDYAEWLIEHVDDDAFSKGLYGGDDPLLEPTREDIADLDKRIAEVFTAWVKERNVMRHWYNIENVKAYKEES